MSTVNIIMSIKNLNIYIFFFILQFEKNIYVKKTYGDKYSFQLENVLKMCANIEYKN